jgi:LmbE family N-acetylglucosaminyl deacetylase
MKIFLSPHADDETLFGAFTIMRDKPLVVVVFDGYVQVNRGATKVTYLERRRESRSAMQALGTDSLRFLGLRDDDSTYTAEDIKFRLRSVCNVDAPFDTVYSPMFDGDGHDDHNLVSRAADLLPTVKHVKYSTYTRNGGRQRTPNEVQPMDGDMIRRKHLALACYTSQLDMNPKLGCWPHFMDSMREYTA